MILTLYANIFNIFGANLMWGLIKTHKSTSSDHDDELGRIKLGQREQCVVAIHIISFVFRYPEVLESTQKI